MARGVMTISALALSVAMLGVVPAGANEWSYAGDPGFVAKNPAEFAAAKLSWETPEYLLSWGLTAQKASTAYALGYYGQDVTVAMIDSGHNLSHQEFQGDRFTAVVSEGVYGSSGYRNRSSGRPTNPFTAGTRFNVNGDYFGGVATPDTVTPAYPGSRINYNGGHGTAMLGILGANRDGDTGASIMHGFAFGSNILLGNTGSTDANAHGPYHDYTFMYQGYKSLVDAGAEVINSSWGSIQQTEPKNAALDPKAVGRDGSNLTVWYFRDLADEEFVHFYTRKAYSAGGHQYDPNNPGLSYLDAMYNAVKGTSVVHVRSAANQDQENPNNMAFYPYFNPAAEKHWISIGGLLQDGAGDYVLNYQYNEAGPYGKWWHMAVASGDASTSDTTDPATNTNDRYGTAGGTSGSSPHVTGAMALMLNRYADMDAIQVRDVLFTTAQNKKADGAFLASWTAPDGEPDERYGWGYPNVDKGMYGPGQFLSPFTYNMASTPLDVWSNNISEIAIRVKEQEDRKWLADYQAQGVALAGAFNLDNSGYGLYGLEDLTGVPQPGDAAPADYATQPAGTYPDWDAYFDASLAYITIDQADADRWRKEWMDARASYIQNKINTNQYAASLTKQGSGTLVMTGDNTYAGGTTVEGGLLLGFTESFGAGQVNVNAGGCLGVLANYNDLFTMKGALNSTQSRLASINVNAGGAYVFMTGQDVYLESLTFAEGAKIAVAALAVDRDGVMYGTSDASGAVYVKNLAGLDKALLPDNVSIVVDTVIGSNGTVSRLQLLVTPAVSE